jgi:hypothetical protein
VKKKLLHYLFNLIDKFGRWRDQHDICEVCDQNPAYTRCWEGCGKRICDECESFYYEDATICKECEADITPEEREADRRMMEEMETELDLEEEPNGRS